MSTRRESNSRSPSPCCRIEAVISVDERGQMVLPKEIREKARLGAGEKLALIAWEQGGEVCCISLIKADRMGDAVKSVLGPMVSDLRNRESQREEQS